MSDALDVSDPWYRRWFGEEYLSLYPHRDEDEAERAVALMLEQLRPSPGARVLDVGCGAGRHLQALVREGFPAVGLDLSATLLARAHRVVPEAQLVRGDMRSLPFADAGFDAATSFFTSFGYFEREEEDRRVLAELRRVLRPGGQLLVDFLNAEEVASGLTPRDERVVGGRTVSQERRLLGGGRVVEKRIRLGAGPEGEPPREFLERVRLYRPKELEAMLAREGFQPEARLGSYHGDPFHPTSPRLIIVAASP